MHIAYSVFMNNFTCIHLENIPKIKYLSPGTIFYNKEELNI